MKPSKLPSFAERQTASVEARKALVAKFKPKPTVPDPEFEERRLQRQLELEELRAQRAAERQAKREESERKELEAEIAEAMELELRAKQKLARDARYAARKQRRK
jgi:hypothetical protein